MAHVARSAVSIALLLVSSAAFAAIPITPIVAPNVANGNNNAFPTQNPNGPTGTAVQVSYPYPGQCLADPTNAALFPLLGAKTCSSVGTSFACTGGVSPLSAGGWAGCDAVTPFTPVNPILANSIPAAGTPATQKFVWQVLNPPDYTPDKTTFPGADYYEIQLHEAWGFQDLAGLGLFPNPPAAYQPVPNGMQWTGLLCNVPAGCSCPPAASASFKTKYCTSGGLIPSGAPLFTPIWGVGSAKNGLASSTTAGSPWSANNFIATWPSVSIRGTRDTPVVVKWMNEFPNNHVFCPHPEAADWPCAIDRTFMGVKARLDPALTTGTAVPPDGVNLYGSPQQPDNSWVTHLHGGEIPPGTDGFAEKWFGNQITAVAYNNVAQNYVNPPFEAPEFSPVAKNPLRRPAGVAEDTYTYPMVQEEATIWFHDHTLGKTHHNVIAGPAGFFPVKDPAKHYPIVAGTCTAPVGPACTYLDDKGNPRCDCSYSWLDPVTEPRGNLGVPLYDLFFAVQDRSFNDDGSINFSNGLGQAIPAGAALPNGYGPVTSGVNPQVHPVWVPEYFGDHVLVNGVLWPYKDVGAGWYRIRLADGSDSRCWTVGLSKNYPAPNTRPTAFVPFWILANDQGYLKSPVATTTFTMCPGERYELLVNFAGFAGKNVYLTNSAAAPFPAGITPFAGASPYAEMNTIMQFRVAVAGSPLVPAPVGSCTGTVTTGCMPANPALQVDPAFVDIRPPMPFPAGTIVRQVYLNERVDGVTLAPLGMQLNGVPFEYKVTETPKLGSREVWQFVNLTVDAHPMHPHLVKHQIVARQAFNVGAYKTLLCGNAKCQPGTSPGGEMQVVPDVTPTLTLLPGPVLVTAASVEGGWKDATQAPPGQVTTIVADWSPRWKASAAPTAPGTALGLTAGACTVTPPATPPAGCSAASWKYDDVTTGPYVWHCHINSHEDSEMMHTSLVMPATP